jgi:thiosulfate/3-mercaptopyruvate sulfurtransferase
MLRPLLIACVALSWALLSTLPELYAEEGAAALLISAESLKGRLSESQFRLLDARSPAEYADGHIPGAVSVELEDWKTVSLAPGGLHDADAWSQRIGRLGVTRETEIVVYAANATDATRTWWILKFLGLPRVVILDGGWQAWQADRGPVDQHTPEVAATTFQPHFDSARLADQDEVLRKLEAPAVTVIDTRSRGEYRGESGQGARKGHIPGAVHQEWSSFLAEDGRFKSIPQIRELLHSAGLTPGDVHITHCQTGGRASLNCFVMELAGYGPVKNYYCGWSEWSRSETAPVETAVGQ